MGSEMCIRDRRKTVRTGERSSCWAVRAQTLRLSARPRDQARPVREMDSERACNADVRPNPASALGLVAELSNTAPLRTMLTAIVRRVEIAFPLKGRLDDDF